MNKLKLTNPIGTVERQIEFCKKDMRSAQGKIRRELAKGEKANLMRIAKLRQDIEDDKIFLKNH